MKKKDLIKKCVFIAIIVILILVVLTIMLKYEVEGEKALPYEISKILLISTVDGNVNDESEYIWDIDIFQTNDLYIYIDKSEETDETIKEITLNNFTLLKNPEKGEIFIYRPTSDLENLYTYSEQNYLNDEIIYSGAVIDDMKSLEIANTGGIMGFRLALNNLGTFQSNDETEIIYDGNLLSNLGVSLEEIQLRLQFDIIITTSSNISYKGTITIDMPTEEIIDEGSSNVEITDFSDVIFKRI